jgi:hypothetical protein
MKAPLNYKPTDKTLLTSAKPYAYTPPKPFINIKQADYKTWCKADLWTVERAILLLLNAETLPSTNSSYGLCKSNGEQIIYDGFMKIWPIAESSLKIGVLKKIGKGYPSLLCEVLPGDFICWAKLKGYPIPDELKTIGTTTQTEAVGDAGAGNHAGTETKQGNVKHANASRTLHIMEWLERNKYNAGKNNIWLDGELRKDNPDLWGKNMETFNKWKQTTEAEPAMELLKKLKLMARKAD